MLRVYGFGNQKPMLNKEVLFTNDTSDGSLVMHQLTMTLRTVVKKEIMKLNKSLVFNKDDHIKSVDFNGGTNAIDLLGLPVFILLQMMAPLKKKELNVTILISSTKSNDEEATESINLVIENRIEVSMLEPKFSIEET